MAFSFTLPLRVLQVVFAIITLGLTAYGTSNLLPDRPPLLPPSNY